LRKYGKKRGLVLRNSSTRTEEIQGIESVQPVLYIETENLDPPNMEQG